MLGLAGEIVDRHKSRRPFAYGLLFDAAPGAPEEDPRLRVFRELVLPAGIREYSKLLRVAGTGTNQDVIGRLKDDAVLCRNLAHFSIAIGKQEEAGLALLHESFRELGFSDEQARELPDFLGLLREKRLTEGALTLLRSIVGDTWAGPATGKRFRDCRHPTGRVEK